MQARVRKDLKRNIEDKEDNVAFNNNISLAS